MMWLITISCKTIQVVSVMYVMISITQASTSQLTSLTMSLFQRISIAPAAAFRSFASAAEKEGASSFRERVATAASKARETRDNWVGDIPPDLPDLKASVTNVFENVLTVQEFADSAVPEATSAELLRQFRRSTYNRELREERDAIGVAALDNPRISELKAYQNIRAMFRSLGLEPEKGL